MNAVIAERQVTLVDGSSGFVRMDQPQEDRGAHFCELHLAWPGFEQRQKVFGEDSWQSVMLAIGITPLFISLTEDFKSGRLKVFDTPLHSQLPDDPDGRSALAAFFDIKPHNRDVQ